MFHKYLCLICFIASVNLSAQDKVVWVKQIHNLDESIHPDFETKDIFIDGESNYYLFGKSGAIAIQNDTFEQLENIFRKRHSIAKFSNQGDKYWFKDDNLLWGRSWMKMDEFNNFHCIKQLPSTYSLENNPFDIIYNKFDKDWTLIDSIYLVKMDEGIGSADIMSQDIINNTLYLAFSVSSSVDKFVEINEERFSVKRDSLSGGTIFLISYDLVDNKLNWLHRFYANRFINFHVKCTKNEEVYFVANYWDYISVDDGDVQFSANNCSSCTEIFLAMFDSNGEMKWQKQIDEGLGIPINDVYEKEGNLFLLGDFTGFDVKFDDFLLSGQYATVLLKIQENGIFENAKIFSFARNQAANSIEITEDDYILIAGGHLGEGLTEIGDTLYSHTFFNANGYVFVLNENFEQLKSLGIYGQSIENNSSIPTTFNYVRDIRYHNGKLAIAGNFSYNSNIVDTTLTQLDFQFASVHDGYLAVLDFDLTNEDIINSNESLNLKLSEDYFQLAPNPTCNEFRIVCKTEELVSVNIINSEGILVNSNDKWNTSFNSFILPSSGVFYITIENEKYKQQSILVVN